MILHDKDAKNCDGDAYLSKKLEELKNIEFNAYSTRANIEELELQKDPDSSSKM